MKLPQFIVFRLPNKALEGSDPFYDLIELQPNRLQFSIVNAKSMEQARERWFYELYYPQIMEYRISDAALRLLDIFSDYNEEELIKKYGDTDGQLIWKLGIDAGDEEIRKEDAEKVAERLSKKTIDSLVYDLYEMDIGVSAVDAVIK